MKNKKNIFSFVMILFWFSLYAYVPQLSSYANEMGASYKLIGLITGAYGFTQTILRIPLGILSDKLGKRKLFVIIGIFAAILSALSVYLYPNPYTLLAARLLAGVASATWVNFTVLFIAYFDSGESSKAIGIATSNSKIGQLVAMFLGGFIALNFGVRDIFTLSLGVSILSLLMGLFIKEIAIDIKKEKSKTSSGIGAILSNSRILHISFLGMLVQFIAYSTSFGFTPLVAINLGADNLQLSYLSIAYTFPQVFFSVLSGTVMVRKFGEKKTLMIGFIISTLLCFIIPFSPSLNILYIVQFFSGIGNAITFPLLMSMAMKGVKEHHMTTTMGFYQAAYGVGMIVGPIILGNIGDMFGLTYGFMVIGVLSALSIWSLVKVKDTSETIMYSNI